MSEHRKRGCWALEAEVVVVMVEEDVPWPEEAAVDWPSVRLIRTMVGEAKDWEIPREVMGESGGETFGVDGGTVW
ncbi:hypothetical protein Tco_0493941 [Tanacetum coccineum]